MQSNFTQRTMANCQPNRGVDAEGNPTTGDLVADLADYIRGSFPNCPVGGATDPDGIKYSTADSAITGETTPALGWHYNSTTGDFIVNFNGTSNSDATIRYDQF